MTTFDAYVQHQVYVEGYKNGQAQDADTLYEELTAAIVIALMRLKVNTLGELTRKQLNELLREISLKLKRMFGAQIDLTMADIRGFMGVDVATMGKLTGAAYAALNLERLWTRIGNAPVAGVGSEPQALFAEAQAAALAAIIQLIKRAWADNKPLSETLQELVGTKALLNKDGLFSKQRRRLATVIETVIQHVTSEIQFQLGKLSSTHYTWVSILDSRTTAICRERNGHSYEYGKGPRPPAHWGCRSFTVPTTIVTLAEIPNWGVWIKRQPAWMQDDALGPARGRDLRADRLKSDDLGGFDRARPLTVSEYGDRVKNIFKEVA